MLNYFGTSSTGRVSELVALGRMVIPDVSIFWVLLCQSLGLLTCCQVVSGVGRSICKTVHMTPAPVLAAKFRTSLMFVGRLVTPGPQRWAAQGRGDGCWLEDDKSVGWLEPFVATGRHCH